MYIKYLSKVSPLQRIVIIIIIDYLDLPQNHCASLAKSLNLWHGAWPIVTFNKQ